MEAMILDKKIQLEEINKNIQNLEESKYLQEFSSCNHSSDNFEIIYKSIKEPCNIIYNRKNEKLYIIPISYLSKALYKAINEFNNTYVEAIQYINNESDLLISKKGSLQQQIEKLQSEKDNMETEFEAYKYEVKNIISENDSKSVQNKKLHDNYETLKSKFIQLSTITKEVNRQLKISKDKVKNLDNEIETLKRSNLDIKELYRESQEELKNAKKALKNKIEENNTIVRTHRQEIEELKNKLILQNNTKNIDDNEIIENEKNNEIEIENYSTYYNNFPLMSFTGSKVNDKFRPFNNEDIILTILRNLEIRIKYNKDYNLEKLTKELNLKSYKCNTIKLLYRISNNDNNKTYKLIENLIIDRFIDNLSIPSIIEKHNLYKLATDIKVSATAANTYCQTSVNNTLSLLFTYIRWMYIYHLPKISQDMYTCTFSQTYKLRYNKSKNE